MFLFKDRIPSATLLDCLHHNKKERSFRSAQTASMYLSSSTSLSGLVQWNRFSNNSITQWLIGIFVRSYSSKDYLINCAGVRQLKSFGEPFQPEPKNKDAKQFKKLFCLTPIKKATWFGGLYGRLLWKSLGFSIKQS